MRLTGKECLLGRKQQQKREKKDIARGEDERAGGKHTSLRGCADVEIMVT
jgi:hypothetical protein